MGLKGVLGFLGGFLDFFVTHGLYVRILCIELTVL